MLTDRMNLIVEKMEQVASKNPNFQITLFKNFSLFLFLIVMTNSDARNRSITNVLTLRCYATKFSIVLRARTSR